MLEVDREFEMEDFLSSPVCVCAMLISEMFYLIQFTKLHFTIKKAIVIEIIDMEF